MSSASLMDRMVDNRVAANLLMLFILVGGVVFALRSGQEVFPEFAMDKVTVRTTWTGATPEEVENNVTKPIEDALLGVGGVKRVTSTSSEGLSSVDVEVLEGFDVDKVKDDVETEVSSVSGLPDGAEDPEVSGMSRIRSVLTVMVYGDVDRETLWLLAKGLKDAILAEDGVTNADVSAEGERKIRVLVGDAAGDLLPPLSPEDIVSALSTASSDGPVGEVKSVSGDVLYRSGKAPDDVGEVMSVPVRINADGATVRVSDVADVAEDIDEDGPFTTYDGKPAVKVDVYRAGDQTPSSVSEAARVAAERYMAGLPDSVGMKILDDASEVFNQRMEMLFWNGLTGLVLVFVLLGLFLDPRTAAWVSMGIPVSFAGVFFLLSAMGVTVNMVSMFAFLIALGIVVDDAIVVGENIHAAKERGLSPAMAAKEGVRSIATPVVFSVLTNMAAFAPLLFLPGVMGKIMFCVPVVVIGVFGVSLVESLYILPSHLAFGGKAGEDGGMLALPGKAVSSGLSFFVGRIYRPTLSACLSFRYPVIAFGVLALAVVAALVASGRVPVTFMPRVESDYSVASVRMPTGTPEDVLFAVRDKLVSTAGSVAESGGGDRLLDGVWASVSGDLVSVTAYLTDRETGRMSTARFSSAWREAALPIPGAESATFQSDRGGPGAGKALSVELSSASAGLDLAAESLALSMGRIPGVSDIDSGTSGGKESLTWDLTLEGRAGGLTASSLRSALKGVFGEMEAYRVRDENGEIKVVVGPGGRDVPAPEDVFIATPSGGMIPLLSAATAVRGIEAKSVDRVAGRRTVTVEADLDDSSKSAEVLASLEANELPALAEAHPGLSWSAGGKRRDLVEGVDSLFSGLLLAMLAVYALLAVPFRSYFQPVVVMTAIPFGMIGAVAGHALLGYDLSLQSLLGIVALSGVVVNDSLVLTDRYNQAVSDGETATEAASTAARARFRPIMLTTMTTFWGLFPMIMDRSEQAAFLAPMAVSLGFGILFATLVTLVLVPCLLVCGDDIAKLFRKG